MKRIYLYILTLFTCVHASCQVFDEHFSDSTLRLDYIFAGDNKSQHIFFHQAYSMPKWAGRKSRLSEKFLNGNGQITVRDPETKDTLYISTFSTLFQEWQTEEEATKVKKSFENSYLVPFPRKPVEITITLTDTHQKVSSELTHIINPQDILIEQLKSNPYPQKYLLHSGDVSSCVDIAILSEGYTLSEMDKFHKDSQRAVDAIFSHEPFKSMKSKFNVVAIDFPSQESGPSIPHDGIWTTSPLGVHYDTFYVDRYLMTSRMWAIYDALSCVPFEHIIVLVNSSKYGGGGIYNQINVSTSDHYTFKEVLVHEFGHGYGGLGDEYYYDDQYETKYPSDTEPWEPNLTTLVDFSSKWADMLPQGTEIPTTPTVISATNRKSKLAIQNKLTQKVGVFEGGGYQSKGVYRPAQECRMKVNEVEKFCPVCTRALIQITDFYTAQ